MRKSLWITVILALSSVSLAVTGFIRVDRTGDQIEIEETVLFGDKAALDGLAVDHHLYDQVGGGYLYWDTAYRPGTDGLADTEFVYTETPREEPEERADRLTIGTYSGGSAGSSGAIDVMEMGGEWGPLLSDVAGRTSSGTTHEEIVRLADYCEYLPMYVDVNIGALSYSQFGMLSGEDAQEADLQKLLECFRISTPEECRVEISITKRPNGTVSDYSINIRDGMPQLIVSSAVTEEYCYLLVGGTMEDGSPLDTSRMIGDCGIYRIPYEITRVDYKYGISREVMTLHTEEIRQIASFNVNEEVGHMHYDEERDRIEIIYRGATGEENGIKLAVFDAGTGEQIQNLLVTRNEEEVWIREVIREEDFLVITLERSEGIGGFVLLTRGEDGAHHTEFEADFPVETDVDWATWLYGRYDLSVDFDGERMVFGAVVDGFTGGDDDSCRFLLLVYEDGEPVFMGRYASSLGIGRTAYGGCLPWGLMPLEVRWE